MSLFTIGVLVATACLLMAVIGVVSQSMEQKNAEKRLISAGLQRQVNYLHELLSGFPPGHLSHELEVFLCMQIIEAGEKVLAFDARAKIQGFVAQYRERQKELLQTPHPKNQTRSTLKTPQQIKDVKQLLKSLSTVLQSAAQNNSIPRTQANQLKQELNKSILAVSLDSYALAAQQAESTDKLQVAIHYHEQARKLLMANNATENREKILQADQTIKSLSEKLKQQTNALIVQNIANPNPDESKHHSATINDDSDPTKKKQLYD